MVLSSSAVAYEELYAFSYNPKQNDQQREEGWQLIDLVAEYERMGVPCDQWQLTDVNRDYKVDGWLHLVFICHTNRYIFRADVTPASCICTARAGLTSLM